MNFRDRFKSVIQNDWAIAFVLLGLFLLTHGYRFGWDDQFAEIPHLKSLIDPTLYLQDPFVLSLKHYFPTHFYRVLSRLITIEQIPAAYFVLFLVSRYFLFFWIYKFWHLIAGKKTEAFFCALTAMVLVREQHFLYLTFSHAEFAYPFVFAGIYFFHKERFVLAAAILGIAVNFHALYGLYPMIYMCSYLTLTCRKHGWKTLLTSIVTFVTCMSPFLIFMLKTKAALWTQPLTHVAARQDWIALCHIYMPEHFFFPSVFDQFTLRQIFSNFYLSLGATEIYSFLLILYLINITFNAAFQKQLKSHIFVLTAFLLLGVCFVASYIIPNKFIIGLQLLRNGHFLLFVLPGYLTLLLLRIIEKQRLWACFLIGVLYIGLIPRDLVSAICTLLIFLLLLLNAAWNQNKSRLRIVLIVGILLGILLTVGIYIGFLRLSHSNPLHGNVFRATALTLFCLSVAMKFPWFKKFSFISKRLFIILPLVILAGAYTHAHYESFIQGKNQGAFQTAWEDIQQQTRQRAPKDALILAPYDTVMGGFRIHSERSIICEERDIGAFLAFDVEQVYQWEERMKDIRSFKIMANEDLRPALFSALKKYHANYIVFPPGWRPPSSQSLEHLYQNQFFALYKINTSP